MTKVGIFTRSPMVLRDIDLIKQVNARVHMTIAPLDDDMMAQIEPYPIKRDVRWDTLRKLRDEGIRVHVSVAPAFPIVSDELIGEFAYKLASHGIAEFFVDPCQPYAQSMQSMDEVITDDRWPQIKKIMQSRAGYNAWKSRFQEKWIEEWHKVKHLSPDTMPLAADHEKKLKIDMSTGKRVSWDNYDQYENAS